jgi:hypothetical protein
MSSYYDVPVVGDGELHPGDCQHELLREGGLGNSFAHIAKKYENLAENYQGFFFHK